MRIVIYNILHIIKKTPYGVDINSTILAGNDQNKIIYYITLKNKGCNENVKKYILLQPLS